MQAQMDNFVCLSVILAILAILAILEWIAWIFSVGGGVCVFFTIIVWKINNIIWQLNNNNKNIVTIIARRNAFGVFMIKQKTKTKNEIKWEKQS